MIVIKIERKSQVITAVRENLIKKRSPTNIKRATGYSDGREEIAYQDEYEVVSVDKVADSTTTLLLQEIADETKFNLAQVILAINSLGVPS